MSMKTKTNHGASSSPPAHIADLPQWHRWGPHGGPEVVYECAEQPEHAKSPGRVLVWAWDPSLGWMTIQIDPWYYRRGPNAEAIHGEKGATKP